MNIFFVHNVNWHVILIRKGVLIVIIGLVMEATQEVVFQPRNKVLNGWHMSVKKLISSNTKGESYFHCRVVRKWPWDGKNILMVPPAVWHMVVCCRISVWKGFDIRKWPNVMGMDVLQLSCSAGMQQPGFSALKDCYLLDSRLFIGAPIQSLDTSMLKRTLS